jgi:hypothetical protein
MRTALISTGPIRLVERVRPADGVRQLGRQTNRIDAAGNQLDHTSPCAYPSICAYRRGTPDHRCRSTYELPNGDRKGFGRQLMSSLACVAAIETLLTMLRTDLSAGKLPAFVPNCNDTCRTTGFVGIMIWSS